MFIYGDGMNRSQRQSQGESESEVDEQMEVDHQEIGKAENVDELVNILRQDGMVYYWLFYENKFPKQSARLLRSSLRYSMTLLQKNATTELPDLTDWMAVIRWTNLVYFPVKDNIMTSRLIVEHFIVTIGTLKNYVALKKLIDYRPEGHAKTAALMLDAKEVAKHFLRRNP